jgi:hypothetical protein
MPVFPASPSQAPAILTRPSPHHLLAQQDFAILTERQRHNDALYSFGEAAMYILMWRAEDHEAGLVGRCPECFIAYGQVAEAFGQPAIRLCDFCFGTTFEGGYKAKIVRPTIWSTSGGEYEDGPRGEVEKVSGDIESTGDFVLRNGDYVFRADGTRWYVRSPTPKRIVTGFGPKQKTRHTIAYAYASISQEDESSVAFIIPPNTEAVETILNSENLGSASRVPYDYSPFEEIRGSLF